MTLYLLPNLLHATADPKASIVPAVHEVIYDLHGFYIETPKVARQYLKLFDFALLRDKPMIEIGKHAIIGTEEMRDLQEGKDWGVISDAGLPTIADPGMKVVSLARQMGIKIRAFPGPCSITHALALSGLDGNQFTFHGYLPRRLNRAAWNEGSIHLFIEAPYNNIKSLQALLDILKPRDLLGVACDLMGDEEEVIIQKASQWQPNDLQKYHKRPSIIMLQLR